MDKAKDSQTQSLGELQQELKSLKALLLTRGSTLPHSPSASPIPPPGRPSIPAWQLAGANETPSSPSTTLGVPLASSQGNSDTVGSLASPISLPGRPTIPAWQRAGANETSSSTPTTLGVPPASIHSTSDTDAVGNGKGKEVDRSG